MPDWEKVLKGLEQCVNGECASCPYKNSDDQSCFDIDVLLSDTLALLKEQDEGIAPIQSTTEQKKFADRIGFVVSEYWCGKCHFNLFNRPKFCPNCGKKVKWDD